MAYTYKGTKIAGTSTTPKVFKKSGIKKASKGNTYFNKSTGHVYSCTTGGKASAAKWKYLRTDIAKKPTVSVSSLSAPVRQTGNRKMTGTWKIPNAMVDKKKGDRVTDLNIYWYLGIAGADPKQVIKTTNEYLMESTINLNNLKIGNTTYTRQSFYPFEGKPILHYVTIKVAGKNSKGEGASAKNTREFTLPRKPTISDFTFDAENGELSCTIDTDPGDDYRERYDTRYKMTVYYSDTEETATVYDTSTTATSKTITFDDPNYASRSYTDYAMVTVQAWARGFKGDSDTATKVFYISYPAQAIINSIEISDKTSSGKCTLFISTNSTKEHPVDRVKLEYLANSPYADANLIPGDAGWETTDIIDDAQCNAMSIPVGELLPDRGNYTWVRLKTFHANETVLYRYSGYMRVVDLETPEATAADDKIKIVSAVAGSDGKSAVVDLVWDDGDLPSTGTELSWDVAEDAWRSTKEPEDYTFIWSDGEKTIDGDVWPESATITIKSLEESEKYYIKARRYNEGDTTTYSEYSNTATVVTSEKPESVTAMADRYIPKGSGLNVYWTFSGNGLQTSWQIVDSNDTVVANGEGSLGSTQISADRLETLAENGSLTFTVQVSTGSGYVVSEPRTVTLIDKPTLSITAASVVTAQPYGFSAVASVPSDLVVIVTSQGASGQFPDGQRRQTAGDTIYSNVYKPEWLAGQNSGEFTVDIGLPPQLDFWDLGRYTISVAGIDRQTGLRSEDAISEFSVAWSHQAPSIEPTETYTLSADTEVSDDKNYYLYDSETQTYTVVEPEGSEDPAAEGWYELSTVEYVTLEPIDTVDENGFHHQAVQINLTPPPSSFETDVYDIYRVTGDGARLIGQSFPLTYTAVDEYAPFGEDMTNYYRIAARTADGDIAFSDIEYVLEGEGIRLDWSGGFLEYPYGVSIGDGYKKDVDVRYHLDGGVSGYWNQGIERKSSLGTDAIKVLQKSDIDLTRQLARYTGPVFVRTREGTAFEADVQVTDLTTKNVAIMTIAIDATEVDLTDEFMLPIPYEFEEEGE